jgi:UDP-2-acetamido-2,6-beta-L-arabino-hexul-4-ose reductase
MIKVGVTGSNGFIGWHLCRTLELDISKYKLISFKREWFEETDKLDSFVSKCDVIVHLAGVNRHFDEEYIYNTNIDLANKFVESFNRTEFKGQVIFSSSTQEENNNNFGKSKRVAREIFSNWSRKNKTQFNGLLIPNVFGAFGIPNYNSVIATFCHQLINNEIPNIIIDASLNLIYIDDLIKNILKIFKNDHNESNRIPYNDTYKVSEILKILTSFKSSYFEKGLMPALRNQFEINLFNTFRSYISMENHFPIKYKNNVDNRGNFVEIIKLEIAGQVSFSTTQKDITRGNHFHTRKIERFSVIKGKALIQLRKVRTNKIINYYLSGEEPAYVDMPIWHIHNIKNIGEEELYTIFWINEIYDINNSDTYFENV